MVELSRLYVKSFDSDFLDVFWEFRDSRFRVGRYDIYVERSVDGPAGPFYEIAGPFKNTGFCRDPDVNQFHNYRIYGYRLRIVDHEHNDKATTTEAVSLVAEPDLIALEAGRRVNLALVEYIGRMTVILSAITTGFRCPVCYDGSTVKTDDGQTVRRSIGRSKIQNCPGCFDTTFVGGYSTPMVVPVQIDPSPSVLVRSDTYERHPNDTSARLGPFPPVKPKDVLVDPENIRWEVQRISGFAKNGATVEQSITIHQIPKSDIRHTIPINIDPKMNPSPEREFTRPMSIGYQESRSDMAGVLDRIFKRTA